jgi:hypothetical protein
MGRTDREGGRKKGTHAISYHGEKLPGLLVNSTIDKILSVVV